MTGVRALSFTPQPGPAPRTRMLGAQTAMEFRLLLRNGEQVGLTLLIPLLLLFFFNLPLLYSLGTGPRISYVVPSIIALAVMSAAFTGLAIGTGFERKYAVLKRLGATALPRSVLMLGKTCSVLLLELLQVALTLVIPLLLEFFFNLPLLYSLGTPRRIDFVVPSVLALAVMSASFTGLAIGTGFERKYAVLKRLGATALPRQVLIAGKTCAVLVLQVLQAALICLFGLLLGWHPAGAGLEAALLIVVATFAFGGLGLLLAGTVRAEVTLAAANLVWLVLLFAGGIAIPLSRYPDAAANLLQWLPSAALSDGLHQVLEHSAGLPVRPALTLLVWAAVALPAAARWFRWE